MNESLRVAVSLAGPLVVLAFGLALSTFVRGVRARPLAARLGWSYLLGAAGLGVLAFVSSVGFHVALKRRLFVPALLVTIAAAAFAPTSGSLRRRTSRSLHGALATPHRQATLLGRAAHVLGTFAALAVLGEAVTNPVRDWDGRMTWCAQARFMRAETTASPRVLVDDRFYVTHPQYPPLLPLLQVATAETTDAPWDERVPRPLYAAFLPAFLLVLFDAARRRAGVRAAAAVAIAASLLPFLVFENHGGAAGTYSDLPLASFLGAGTALLLFARPGFSGGFAGGLLLAGAALTKNEGTPLALVALAAAGLLTQRRRGTLRVRLARLAPVLLACAMVAGAVFALRAWRSKIPNRNDEKYDEILRDLPKRDVLLAHLRAAIPVALGKTFTPRRWGLFFYALPLVLLAGRKGLRRPDALSLALVALAPLALGLLAYAVHWNPAYLADVTWSRFLLHGLMPLLLLTAPALRVLQFEPTTNRRAG